MTNTPDPPESKGTPAVQSEDEDMPSLRRLSSSSGDLPQTEHQFPASPITPRRRLRNLDGKLLVSRPPIKREPVDPPEYTGEMALVPLEETKIVVSDLSDETRNNTVPSEIKDEPQEETNIVPSDCHLKSKTKKYDDDGGADPAMSRSNSHGSENSSKRDHSTVSTKAQISKEETVAVSPDGDKDMHNAMVPFNPSPAPGIPSSEKAAEDNAPEKTNANEVSGQKLVKRSNSKGLSRSNSKGMNRSNSKGKTERRSSKNDCAEKHTQKVSTALVATGRDGGALVVRKKSSNSSNIEIREGFDHCYVSVPRKDRLSALFATLRRNSDRKIVVIFSSCESAKFHATLFRQLEMLPVHEMHESIGGTAELVKAYDKYLHCYPGILFASEKALRDFDIPPNVDYVLQYEPPMIPTEYVYRMQNAKAFATSCRKALLFLVPDSPEMNFLRHFEGPGFKVHELQARRVDKFQERVEKLVLKHEELNEMAWRAFRSFRKFYEHHSSQGIFDFGLLEKEDGAVMKSFAQPYFPGYARDVMDENLLREGNVAGRDTKKNEDRERFNESSTATKKHAWYHGKEKSGRHREDDGGMESSNSQADWMKGKQKVWRNGAHTKSWMTKEKLWKHAHVTTTSH
ncbi:hypothetical protein ACHAXS_003195 [Conticribra weissflogii]